MFLEGSAPSLERRLAVPVLNPGPISYHVAELMLKANLRHSKAAYPSPRVPADEKLHAMLEAAAKFPWPE
jgi:allantoin racemase